MAIDFSFPPEIEHIRQLPFGYRDSAVLERMQALELGEAVARYRIQFVLKQ